jgi:hypothetical protein
MTKMEFFKKNLPVLIAIISLLNGCNSFEKNKSTRPCLIKVGFSKIESISKKQSIQFLVDEFIKGDSRLERREVNDDNYIIAKGNDNECNELKNSFQKSDIEMYSHLTFDVTP